MTLLSTADRVGDSITLANHRCRRGIFRSNSGLPTGSAPGTNFAGPRYRELRPQLSIVRNPKQVISLLKSLLVREFAGDLVARKRGLMLWTLFVILLVLWLLGVVSSYTLGGFIHILLVLAVIALVFQLITGRRSAL